MSMKALGSACAIGSAIFRNAPLRYSPLCPICKVNHLVRGNTKSCGCINRESKSKLRVGDKVNRLTLLEYLIGKWRCKCDCGNEIIVNTCAINSNNTKSCGCLKTEKSSKRSGRLISGRRKFDPKIATARKINSFISWRKSINRDNNDKIFKNMELQM